MLKLSSSRGDLSIIDDLLSLLVVPALGDPRCDLLCTATLSMSRHAQTMPINTMGCTSMTPSDIYCILIKVTVTVSLMS